MDANQSTAEVTISIPADTRFVSLARTTAATLAAELDFTIDEVEELRVAANELVGLVIEWAEDHEAAAVELHYELGPDHLRLRVASHGSGDTGSNHAVDQLAQQILRAVTDDYDIGDGHGWLVKRRAAQ